MRKPDGRESFRQGSKDDPKVIEEFNWLIRIVIFALILSVGTEFFPEHSNFGFAVGTVAGGVGMYIVSPRTLPHWKVWLMIAAACVFHGLYFAWRGTH